MCNQIKQSHCQTKYVTFEAINHLVTKMHIKLTTHIDTCTILVTLICFTQILWLITFYKREWIFGYILILLDPLLLYFFWFQIKSRKFNEAWLLNFPWAVRQWKKLCCMWYHLFKVHNAQNQFNFNKYMHDLHILNLTANWFRPEWLEFCLPFWLTFSNPKGEDWSKTVCTTCEGK